MQGAQQQQLTPQQPGMYYGTQLPTDYAMPSMLTSTYYNAPTLHGYASGPSQVGPTQSGFGYGQPPGAFAPPSMTHAISLANPTEASNTLPNSTTLGQPTALDAIAMHHAGDERHHH